METASKLPGRVRAVIGLYHMGYRDPERIARHIFHWRLSSGRPVRSSCVAFVGRVLDEPGCMVERCLQLGLPAGVSGYVRCPVCCPVCGEMVHYVPCIACTKPTWREAEETQRSLDRYKALEPDRPTSANPGSPEKVEIMAERVASGHSPFHPRDNQKVVPPPPVYRPYEPPVYRCRDIAAAYRDQCGPYRS